MAHRGSEVAGTRNPIKGVATAVLLESMRPAVCLDGIEIVWSGVAVGGKTRRKKKSDKGEKTQTGRITGAVNRIGCGTREIETEKKGLYRSVFCEDGCFDKPMEEGSIGGGGRVLYAGGEGETNFASDSSGPSFEWTLPTSKKRKGWPISIGSFAGLAPPSRQSVLVFPLSAR